MLCNKGILVGNGIRLQFRLDRIIDIFYWIVLYLCQPVLQTDFGFMSTITTD